MPLSFAKSG